MDERAAAGPGARGVRSGCGAGGRLREAGGARGAGLAAAPPAPRDEEAAAAGMPGSGAGAAGSGAGLPPPEGLPRRRLPPHGRGGPGPVLSAPPAPGGGACRPARAAPSSHTGRERRGAAPQRDHPERVRGSSGAPPAAPGTPSAIWGSHLRGSREGLVVGRWWGEEKAVRVCDGGCLLSVVAGAEQRAELPWPFPGPFPSAGDPRGVLLPAVPQVQSLCHSCKRRWPPLPSCPCQHQTPTGARPPPHKL